MPPFFYGWLILALSILGLLFSLPGQTNGVSAFIEPILASTGLSRGNLSLAYLLGTLGSSLLLSSGGRLYDRLGPRILGSLVSGSLGLVLILSSQSYRLLEYFPAWRWSGLRLFPFTLFVVIFFSLRFFGQGLLTLTSRTMLMQWFVVRRSLANAIMGLFMTLGFSLVPKFFHMLIQRWQWHGAWFLLGCLELFFMVLFWALGRDAPRNISKQQDNSRQPQAAPESNFTLAGAQRTISFWVFSLSLTLQALFVSGQTFHILSIFRNAGFNQEQAFSIFFPSAVLAVTVNFFASWQSDRVAMRHILAFQAIGLAISSLSQSLLGHASLAFWGLVMGKGISDGLFNLLNTVTWVRFYGTRHLGAISGRSMTFIVGGSAVGPYIFSSNLSTTGTYTHVTLFTALISAILIVISLYLPVLPKQTQ